MKLKKLFVGFPILLGMFYIVGPRVDYPDLKLESSNKGLEIEKIDSVVLANEAKIVNIKEDNEARVVWADSTHAKTKYAIVYLHGFSASQEEGDPLHTSMAAKFDYNLYLPRLYDHGRNDKNTFMGFDPQKYVDSALEAVEIGKILGDSVIVMSCSTGSTLSILLADEPRISSFVMYSPNIDLYDPMSKLITWPWGGQILDLVMGEDYHYVEYDSLGNQYWNPIYHTDGIIGMRWILDNYMNKEYFEKIDQPLMLAYYYKNEEEQDKVVSINDMYEFFSQISTDANKKELHRMNEAGHHVISSYVMSNEIERLKELTYNFLVKHSNY